MLSHRARRWPRPRQRQPDLAIWLRRNQGPLLALRPVRRAVRRSSLHPRGLTVYRGRRRLANQGLALAFAAMAQTLPVLTGGLDLSVGTVLALSQLRRLASGQRYAGCRSRSGSSLVLLTGAACGFLNGVSSSTDASSRSSRPWRPAPSSPGSPIWSAPDPGGRSTPTWATLLTGDGVRRRFRRRCAARWRPAARVVAVQAVVLGRGCYAAGSSEAAAYMSGLDVDRARLAAYALGGLLAACGGLFLGLQTLSGDAHVGDDIRCARSPPW